MQKTSGLNVRWKARTTRQTDTKVSPLPNSPITRILLLTLLTLLLSGIYSARADSATIKSAFATIHFESRAALREFNSKLGCNLPQGVCLGNDELPEASSGHMVSTIVERIQQLLGIHANDLHFHIHLLPKVEDVNYIYRKLYGEEINYIAFYSPQNETIYLAAESLKQSVLHHEITHAIVDRYFDKAPPVRIHELLAQYVEEQL